MKDIIKTIQSIPNMLSLKAATTAEITNAEIELRIRFSDEYKKYLLAFGAIIADGIELTGIANSKHRDVVSVTKQEWNLNNNVPHTMYVIENAAISSIIIWQSSEGKIFKTTPNSKPTVIAESLYEYLRERIS